MWQGVPRSGIRGRVTILVPIDVCFYGAAEFGARRVETFISLLDWLIGTIVAAPWWGKVLTVLGAIGVIWGAVQALAGIHDWLIAAPRRKRKEAQRREEERLRIADERARDLEQTRMLEEQNRKLDDVTALVQTLVADRGGGAIAGILPGGAQAAAEQVREAVTAAAEEAAGGDARMAEALALLETGDTGAAEKLFLAVADDKAQRADTRAKEAAAAYRHAGAIAGLGDPKAARMAYARAAELDPDHADGLLWHGWLQMDAGNLEAAHQAFERVLTLRNTTASNQDELWARFGLGDIARCPLALRSRANARPTPRRIRYGKRWMDCGSGGESRQDRAGASCSG